MRIVCVAWAGLLISQQLAMAGSVSSANVAFVSGQVEVWSQGVATLAKSGQVVAAGESVKTGKDSAAILELSDGSRVKLNPESTIDVGTAEKGKTDLTLQSGAVFSKVAKQSAQGHFVIRTRSAVMGVRGTEFFTAFGKAPGKTADTGADLWMCVHEGKVEVQGTAKDGKKVLVNPGEGVFVPVGKDVTPPKKYGWTESLNWNMDPKAGELIDRTRIDYQDLRKQDYD